MVFDEIFTEKEIENDMEPPVIGASMTHCSELLAQDEMYFENESVAFCDVIWDGLLCWPKTWAGNMVTQPCPQTDSAGQALSESEVATKQCTENGSWFYREEVKAFWTNYSLCHTLLASFRTTVPPPTGSGLDLIEKWFPIVKTTSRIGYAVSLITLLIAILVLTSVKKLRCPRNTLHMHLFVSFILRASMALLKDSLFVQGVGLPSDVISVYDGVIRFLKHDNWECKVVISVWEYSIMANYSWILMEGLYLHSLIFQALFSDTSEITLYIVLGWGLPSVFVAPWAFARARWDNTLCWTTHSNKHVYMLIKVPIVISVLLSFALFVNIVRVLLLKLRASGHHGMLERRHVRYRRWAKSTLILVPLFGVHYAVFLGMSYYVGEDQTVEIVWLFCDQLFGSFQGCLVALLYCLLNAEVRCEVSRKWHSWKSKGHHSRASSLSSAGNLVFTNNQPITLQMNEIQNGYASSTPAPVTRMSDSWL